MKSEKSISVNKRADSPSYRSSACDDSPFMEKVNRIVDTSFIASSIYGTLIVEATQQ